MSGGIYCTQCEAEDFAITYYPDRPDVMAPFGVRIESDLRGVAAIERQQGRWQRQMGGIRTIPGRSPPTFSRSSRNLVNLPDTFTTRSGRKVELNIWVRPGDLDRAYAMDSLIRSMKWDEDAYGREYGLDVFNIVAVDDFNMGAMENKGLNIFNSKLICLAETATASISSLEGVIAHEYFWRGRRIACATG